MTVPVQVRMRRKRRGGASFPCPRCEGPSRVLDTRRRGSPEFPTPADNSTLPFPPAVRRERRCSKKSCAHRFYTLEVTHS